MLSPKRLDAFKKAETIYGSKFIKTFTNENCKNRLPYSMKNKISIKKSVLRDTFSINKQKQSQRHSESQKYKTGSFVLKDKKGNAASSQMTLENSGRKDGQMDENKIHMLLMEELKYQEE